MVGEIKVNYNLECEKILNSLDLNNKKTLLLHACCAPCSSAVLERISKYFKITILFYNPNITDYSEYLKRKEELKRLIKDSHCVSLNVTTFVWETVSPPYEYKKERDKLQKAYHDGIDKSFQIE